MAAADPNALPPSGRRRQRDRRPRPHRMAVKLNDDELVELRAAAAAAGKAPGAYVAESALAVARGQLRPLPSSWRGALWELLAARRDMAKLGNLVNQVARVGNATGQLPEHTDRVFALVRRRLIPMVDDLSSTVDSLIDREDRRGRRSARRREVDDADAGGIP